MACWISEARYLRPDDVKDVPAKYSGRLSFVSFLFALEAPNSSMSRRPTNTITQQKATLAIATKK